MRTIGTIKKTNIKITLTGSAIMLLGVVIKVFNYKTNYSMLSLLRSLLYMAFFALWAFSLNHRIIQKTSKKILIAIALSELLWILFRTLKYEFLKADFFQRYLWYCYYLPNLMIPSLCLMLAISMRKSENYKLPKKLFAIPVISLSLFLLVLTNDFHQSVFIIPPGPDGIEVGFYTYGLGFFVIAFYILLCVIACYGIILSKCRIRVGKFGKIRHFLPLIPLAVIIAVTVWYVMGNVVLFGFYHLDITVFTCYLTTATLEMCIQSGLIMSNAGYNELFSIGSLHAVITDEIFSTLTSSNDYIEGLKSASEISPLILTSVCDGASTLSQSDLLNCPLTRTELQSSNVETFCGCNFKEVSKDDMTKSKNAPVMMQNGMRLSCSAIKGGNVLWQDDLSELQKILQSLSEKKDYLKDKNDAIQKANSYQKKEQQLIAQNRLYNQIFIQAKSEIEQYASLVEQLNDETDSEKLKRIALRLALVGTFIKRRVNLIFLNEMDNLISPSELSYCIEESLSNLRLGDVECFCSYSLTRPIAFEKISRMYESFYYIVLERVENISSLCVYLIEEENEAAIVVRFFCTDCDSFDTDVQNVKIEKENSEWVVTIK